MRVGIMPGSFNPPHLGHLEAIKSAKGTMNLDEVWIVPVPQSRRKRTTSQLGISEKIKICRTISNEHEWIRVFDYESLQNYEFENKRTINIIHEVKTAIKGMYAKKGIKVDEYFFICGSDAMKAIRSLSKLLRWMPPIENRPTRSVLSGTTFIVWPRSNGISALSQSEIQIGWGRSPIKTVTLGQTSGPYRDISSSRIRAALASGESGIYGLTPEAEMQLAHIPIDWICSGAKT